MPNKHRATQEERQAVERATMRYGADRHALVQILREVQSQTGWLSPEVLRDVAERIHLTPAVVQGVASFYHFFHLQPVGHYHFLWSDNITDQMLGSRALANELARSLNVSPGKWSTDALASVDFTSCTGMCDQGPAILVNQQTVLTRMSSTRVEQLAQLVSSKVPIHNWPENWQLIEDQIERSDILLSAPKSLGDSLRRVQLMGKKQALHDIDVSALRGRGGAGFSTAKKWQFCLDAPVPEGEGRVVVCNADEGEPGTFKDRVLLSQQADAVFEGMTIAALLINATRGLIYLRGEYRYLQEALERTLSRRREDNLLGKGILGINNFDFDIKIHIGAGAYVCGEESALIESLEGKRGVPRIRPPFPVEKGYLGLPTVVNNVETFCAVTQIARLGGATWAAIGTQRSTGTKIHSISGDCQRPGIYEFPYGTSVAEILDACGAYSGSRRVQAVQVGGPSGTCLSSDEFDRCIAFEDVPSAGAFMIFDQSRDMFEVARNFAGFFAHESCGFCTPCRVGTALVVRRMNKLAQGLGSVFDENELQELESLLHGTTHCGLGATATNPLRDTLQKFRPAYEQRLQRPSFTPGFDLDAELEIARKLTGRDDADAHLVWKE